MRRPSLIARTLQWSADKLSDAVATRWKLRLCWCRIDEEGGGSACFVSPLMLLLREVPFKMCQNKCFRDDINHHHVSQRKTSLEFTVEKNHAGAALSFCLRPCRWRVSCEQQLNQFPNKTVWIDDKKASLKPSLRRKNTGCLLRPIFRSLATGSGAAAFLSHHPVV